MKNWTYVNVVSSERAFRRVQEPELIVHPRLLFEMFFYIICLILQSQLDVGPSTFSFIKKKPFFVKNICNVSYSFLQLQNFNTESSNNTVIANQDEAKAEDLKASHKWPSRRSIWIIS